ncbi:MAG TPA: alpha/beta fold hydrolase [Ilumatobacteraceae bacterium]|nr:alpha/beta fold hydrolase [Ilumatobacteraceae bacterium]
MVACGDEPSTSSSATVDPARPFTLFTPSTYRDGSPMPLVILLHGLGETGLIEEYFWRLEPLAESRGFLYVHPNGSLHPAGDRFWNATDACCGFGSTVDDVAYLMSIIDEVSATRDVDPDSVFVMGHSNGGFMSYRMACDAADRVAAIVSLAGATWNDPAKCDPSQPVSVLQIHGTADVAVTYDGARIDDGAYPGAVSTVATWAGYDGCDGTPVATGETLDLEPALPGDETSVTTFDDCPTGVAVVLWTLDGGSHTPANRFDDGSRPMSDLVIDWLLAHPRP